MDNYQRQQFDFFLQTAVERFVERLEQRCRGSDAALHALRTQPDSEVVWLNGFVDAVMSEFLLDNVDGASFILRALARKNLDIRQVIPDDGNQEVNVGEMLVALARNLLRTLISNKALEALEQHATYQPVEMGES